ncbi:TIGR03086 family metal-binding protein [Mycolicibacterium litorale]|uniref:TIGR03086 family metal-binding protein n=1 Tax=Mycolicibacterium litorale TaxID=758802 RepID=UPI003CEE184F
MLTNTDVRRSHRIAVETSVRLVSNITPADLGRATPCAGWDLGDLLVHMTVQHRGFAAAARGRGADHTMWDPGTVADAVRARPADVYSAAADDVLAAFAAEGVLDTPFALPEFGSDAAFPGSMAIQFHFVDYVVHGWDVARAAGLPFDIPADVVGAAAPIAFAVPDGEMRDADDSPFAPALAPSKSGRSELDRILRHLGRSPDWRP